MSIIQKDIFPIDINNIKNIKTFISKAQILEDCQYIQKLSKGIFTFLPKGQKIVNKIINILKEILNKFNIKEISFPSLTGTNLFQNRIDIWNNNLFLIKDKISYLLSPTAEEIAAITVKKILNSYKILPIHLYQIGKKFRKEKASCSLYRTNEFLMKDSYGFFLNTKQMLKDWKLMHHIYYEFFRKIELFKFIIEKNNTSDKEMKSLKNTEFLIENQYGESILLYCAKCKLIQKLKTCYICKKKNILSKFIEVAHLFQLDKYYSKKANLSINYKNKKQYLIMNSYGIGISRVIFTIAHTLQDKYGLKWPICISPQIVNIIPANDKFINNAKIIYNKIILLLKPQSNYIDLDLRKYYLGYKIKDSLLNGTNYIIIIGENYKKKNQIELYIRNNYPKKYLLNSETLYNFLKKSLIKNE